LAANLSFRHRRCIETPDEVRPARDQDGLRNIRPAKAVRLDSIIPEISPAEAPLLARFAPYTMTGHERQWALVKAIEYLNENRIAGDVVECGVWRGGNMLIAKALCRGLAPAR
jgi:hypothetical protein